MLAVLCASGAAAGTLRIDLDHDGIRDIVNISQVPSRPALELWLSSTQRVLHLHVKSTVNTVVAADVDADGWPDLVAASSTPGGKGLHIWRNAGHGLFQRLTRRHRARHGQLAAHADGRVTDPPDAPPSTEKVRTIQHTGAPTELSYFPFHLTPSDCTIPVQYATPRGSHAPPKSPRAPPAPALV